MFNFDTETTAIFQAVRRERHPFFRFAKNFKKLFFVLSITAFTLFLYGFILERFTPEVSARLLGTSAIFLVFNLAFWLIESFFNLKIKNPRLRQGFGGQAEFLEDAVAGFEECNLAEFLDFASAKAVWRAIEFKKSKKLNNVDSSALFYFLLADNPEQMNFIFSRALLNLKEIKKALASHFKIYTLRQFAGDSAIEDRVSYSDDFQAVIFSAFKTAQEKNHLRITLGDIITALAKEDLIFKKILMDANLKIEDIENLTKWLEFLESEIDESKKFWEWKNLIKNGSVAKNWTAGYAITLDRFSVDLSEEVKMRGFPEIIGHQKEIEAVERVLARRESNNNVLLVGESGSGRNSIAYALAERSVLGKSLPEINYKRVVKLDLPSLLANIESIEEVESILDAIFRESISAGNIILVIDELHNYVGLSGGQRPGAIDISGILSNYLSLVSFQILAITTYEGLHKNIEQNPSILSLFEKVEVSEISEKETLALLESLALGMERGYKMFVSYPALREIVILCAKYLPALSFPEKAVNLLDEAMVYTAQRKEKILLPSHIQRIISEKTEIPVGEVEIKERKILLNMENLIHQRIIDQEEAVKEVAAALRRARAEISVRKGPMGAFLFLGPTGVGKTETSKALSEIYFGSEDKMIRLDMSEFQRLEDIPRLLGSAGQEGLLTTPARENPFSLVLLDEFEKAHPNILNLFLQVFDEGHITDGLGRKIDFKNTLIIATSNAGYQIILEALKKKTKWREVKEKLLDFVFEKGIFRPELINRFDGVIVFKPLTKKDLLDIADLLFRKIKKNLAQKEIDFTITSELKEKIVELGYDPRFGAREMRRVIQDKVENVLASAILEGKIKRGSRVRVEPEKFKLIIE